MQNSDISSNLTVTACPKQFHYTHNTTLQTSALTDKRQTSALTDKRRTSALTDKRQT